MALSRVCIVSALLVLLGTTAYVRADSEDDEGVTIEAEEEEQYHSPTVDPKKVFLAEHFDDEAAFKKRWVKSEAKKQDVEEVLAKYDGVWEIQEPIKRILKGDLGLVLTSNAKHAAISTLLERPFVFQDKPLVVQYEVNMQEGQNCGGAYIKLLSRGTNSIADLRKFYDQTPYTIMFGPDKCGNDHKLHFIFRHVNPLNKSIEEKHCNKPKQRLEDIYKDKEPHLYTLIVRPDNSFTVLIDQKEVNSGSLLEDFIPPVNPDEEIDDPDDKKPADWDEREQIVDPDAQKPDDWDEDAPAKILDPNAVKPDGWLDDAPEMIPDPNAKKPSDWDEDMDGEYEPPLIDNPECTAAPGCGQWSQPLIPNPAFRGPWRAPLIPNPNYKGKWTPRRIPNPHFFRDDNPFKMTPIHAVGFELWSISPRLLFDNLIITDDPAVADEWAEQTFAPKRAKLARDSRTWWARLSRTLNNRPGWWLAYACYCAIPISLYIAYLIRRSREDSVVDRMLKFAGDHPWVWAVLIFVLVVIVGSIAYCCVGGKSDQEPLLDPKKTDAFLPDDQAEPSDGEGEAEGEVENAKEGEGESAKEGEGEGEAPPPRRGKAQLEPEPEPAPQDNEQPEPVSTTNAATSTDVDGSGDHQRRRRPRKE